MTAGPTPAGPSGGGTYDEPVEALRATAAIVVASAAALALSGCAATAPVPGQSPGPAVGETETRSARPPAPAGTGTAADPTSAGSVAHALDDLLRRRERAVLAHDADAFTATVADPSSGSGALQLAAFRSALDLRLSRLAHDLVPPVEDPAAGVEVRLRYRVAGVDRADRTTTVRYRLSPGPEGWLVAAEEPAGGDAAAAWLAMPGMRVARGAHAVAAGSADDDALARTVATVDAVLPGLATAWEGTPGTVLVLVPGTRAEADALLARSTPPVGTVAATTEGPVGADGLATGDRVVLDPGARARLTPTGREVVLAHELAHVAVRATLPGTTAPWLSEGYADHVGYARADLPAAALAAPLVRAVAEGEAPRHLPGAADLDPTRHDIEVAYLAAWQAVELLAAQHGEVAVRRLVRACTLPGGAAAAERACDAALPRVAGSDRATLTRQWRQRVADLGR